MSNYQTAFPGLTAANMPAIPADWQDMSWRNDLCPSFAFMIGSEGDSNHKLARVWVDHAEPASREFPESPRYSVTFEGGTGDCFDALATDDWAEVLAYVEARRDLGKAYAARVGHNPFLDDPAIDPAEVAATMAEMIAA
jgi:hypothetical protein